MSTYVARRVFGEIVQDGTRLTAFNQRSVLVELVWLCSPSTYGHK